MNLSDLSVAIEELAHVAMLEKHPDKHFIAGESEIPVTGKVFGAPELAAAVHASLDFWLTSGPYSSKFEKEFARKVGMRSAHMPTTYHQDTKFIGHKTGKNLQSVV
jgi:CDP-6-deoxy-D-xylo-4-hexulose-3-dehydrase